jgi:hypothetical protein
MKKEIESSIRNLKQISEFINSLSSSHSSKLKVSSVPHYNKKIQGELKYIKKYICAMEIEIDREEKIIKRNERKS